jgi:hypothetical protein
MDTAIAALDTIYSTVLVKECSPELLREFRDTLNRIKQEWSRKSRIEEFLTLLRNGNLEEWRRLFKEAHDDYQAGYNIAYCNGIPYNHNITLLNESWVKFDTEEKEKVRKQTEANIEFARRRMQEVELLEEARRRLDALQREQMIQELIRSLTDKNT